MSGSEERAAARPNGSVLGQADDMHDVDREIAEYERSAPVLHRALKEIRESLEDAFDEADRRAKAHREGYKRTTGVATASGTLAVVLTITQLALERLGHTSSVLETLELIAVVIVGIAVVWGLVRHRQENWLLERYRAEQLRLLKFASLTDPHLCSDGIAHPHAWRTWKDRLVLKVEETQSLRREDLAHEAVMEGIPDPPPDSAFAAVDRASLRGLLHYYQRKRLDVQRRYFADRCRRESWSDNPRLLPLFFFASVGCVAAHLFFGSSMIGSTAFVVLSAVVPVVWAGIRTYRQANEFGRNASRARAKHFALSRLSEQLEEDRETRRVFWNLQLCEFILESDQREWLRLMREAEWYG